MVALMKPMGLQEEPQAFFFFFLAALSSMWDLSSPARDQTCPLCTGSVKCQPLDYREAPALGF